MVIPGEALVMFYWDAFVELTLCEPDMPSISG
jgi:hypothetical protein